MFFYAHDCRRRHPIPLRASHPERLDPAQGHRPRWQRHLAFNPTTGDWITAANWTPNTVPRKFDIATFNVSNLTDITFAESKGIYEILFNPRASALTFTVSHFSVVSFTIVGIVNNSSVTQNFVCLAEEDSSFNLGGRAQGTLTQGTVFTVISNTSAAPINGAFNNLTDGATLTVIGNNLQASYTCGDGKDLTLTVVP